MNSETKLFVGMLVATVVVIVGAALVFSRPANVPKANPLLLMNDESHKSSSASASVTMVEFGDFQCPACGQYHGLVKQLLERNKDVMTLVFRQFPLDIHSNAIPSAKAAEAAGMQGKFWEMYDKLYERQSDWSELKDPTDMFVGYAKDLGMNTEQFIKDMQSDAVKKAIDRDTSDATALGVNATPTFYVNGEKIVNPVSLEEFETIIKKAAAKPTGQ